MELEDDKTERMKTKRKKIVDEFQEYILQQKVANTEVKT